MCFMNKLRTEKNRRSKNYMSCTGKMGQVGNNYISFYRAHGDFYCAEKKPVYGRLVELEFDGIWAFVH